MNSLAILIDGGYFKKCYYQRHRKSPIPDNVSSHCEKLLDHPKLANQELLRIFYYDCLPYDGELMNPFSGDMIHYSQTEQYKNNMDFFDELKVKENFAFRQGNLQLNGWKIQESHLHHLIKAGGKIGKNDIKEDFNQKGMDMKIGLDIAWLSLKRIVDSIVLVTGDTDFVPAMKFARREGVKVILNILSQDCSPSLKEHSDLILKLSPIV